MMNRVNFGRLSGTVDRRLPRTRNVPRRRRAPRHRDVHQQTAASIWRASARRDDLEAERHRLTLLKAQIESRSHDTKLGTSIALGDSILEIRRMLKEE